MTTIQWYEMFVKINQDSPEEFIELSDIETNADQIHWLSEEKIPMENARNIARQFPIIDEILKSYPGLTWQQISELPNW